MFEGRNDEFVSPEGQDGSRGECRIPCSLQASPGRYTVRSKGMAEQIEVRSSSSTVRITHSCVSCHVTGGIFVALSIPLLITGGAALRISPDEAERPQGSSSPAAPSSRCRALRC